MPVMTLNTDYGWTISIIFMIKMFDIYFHLFIYFWHFFESVFLYLVNTTPTASHTTEKQMHVVDTCFLPLPLTTTQDDGV